MLIACSPIEAFTQTAGSVMFAVSLRKSTRLYVYSFSYDLLLCVQVNIAVHCLSTDFSNQKGVKVRRDFYLFVQLFPECSSQCVEGRSVSLNVARITSAKEQILLSVCVFSRESHFTFSATHTSCSTLGKNFCPATEGSVRSRSSVIRWATPCPLCLSFLVLLK